MGKTSALVSHTLQPLLEDLLLERQNETGGQVECRAASLLLVDRSVDLFTPSQHCPAGPLAHRVLALLPRQVYPGDKQLEGTGLTDVALLQASGGNQELLMPPLALPNTCTGAQPEAEAALLYPMSALAGLPFPLLPSIAPPFSPENQHCSNALFLHGMLAQPEEEGREVLCAALTSLLPPQQRRGGKRKKGLGAELLGLVTAITSCEKAEHDTGNKDDSRESESDGDDETYSSVVVDAYSGLLGWALAVMEAMQRSSSKQLAIHLQRLDGDGFRRLGGGRASFELRHQRERNVFSRLLQAAADMGEGLGGVSAEQVVRIIMEECDLQTDHAGAVKDVKHTMLLTLR